MVEVQSLHPIARHEGLIVREAGDDIIVYDRDRNRAHALNFTVKRVWAYCDGKTDVMEMRERLERETGEPVAEDTVWYALRRLQAARLLQNADTFGTLPRKVTRKTAVRIGVAGVLAPAISTLALPSAALAASVGQPCGSGQGCAGTASTICCTSGTNINKCGFASGVKPMGVNCTASVAATDCCSGACGGTGGHFCA